MVLHWLETDQWPHIRRLLWYHSRTFSLYWKPDQNHELFTSFMVANPPDQLFLGSSPGSSGAFEIQENAVLSEMDQTDAGA
jgi:hypothetical protein